MTDQDYARVRAAVAELNDTSGSLRPVKAEELVSQALTPILKASGYSVSFVNGLDFIAYRAATDEYQEVTLGAEIRFRRQPLPVEEVYKLVGQATMRQVDRAILFARNFTAAANLSVQQNIPVKVELVTFKDLERWAEAVHSDHPIPPVEDQIRAALSSLSRALIEIVAKDPAALRQIEWRQMEILVAELFEGLGFNVTLTPPAKDGGKDVILEFKVDTKTVSYIVEVKHWSPPNRAGQKVIGEFLKVVAREDRLGGLVLSTSGFCDNAFELLTEIDRQKLRFGSSTKICTLCSAYVKSSLGLWSAPPQLAEVIYEETF